MYVHPSKVSHLPALRAIAATEKRHSTTRLLYLVPRVNSFGLGVHEFAITSYTDFGILTTEVLISGMKSILMALPI